MNATKNHALRIALVLGSIAVLAALLPVLGLVALGLLTLVVPLAVVLSPVLVLLSLGLFADRMRARREAAEIAADVAAVHASPIWASAARPSSP